MKKFAIILVLLLTLTSVYSLASNQALATSGHAATPAATTDTQTPASQDSVTGSKALSSAIAIGLAAGAAAIAMGIAVAKALEAISRQPEAEGKIRTSMMLGMVFIETVVIYALIVAILIIFVL